MTSATRDFVWERAPNQCEYCHLAVTSANRRSFHIEHIRARKHHGSDHPSNLALACVHCNLHKGPNLTGVDPATGNIALLFHPRTDSWSDHFSMTQGVIIGLTDVGRTTINVLLMNATRQVQIRAKS